MAPRPDARAVAPAGGEASRSDLQPATSFEQSFIVHHPMAEVWALFGRLTEVVACLPGAALTGDPRAPQVPGRMRIKVGPLAADFVGIAEIDRDDSAYSGVIRGSGRDTRGASAVRGLIRYQLR